MTSINALKLDFYSGLMICDEARYWNPEWMIFFTAEKIRSVIREDIQKKLGIAMFMGQTGASSIGDEFSALVEKEITKLYEEDKKRHGKEPESFKGIKELAEMAFEVGLKAKDRHLNDFFVGKFGFSVEDLVRGTFFKGGQEFAIKDEDLTTKACQYLTFEGKKEDVTGIMGNSQVLAGYDPVGGFRIFFLSQRTPECEEVSEIFLAQGSARDTCDLVFSDFANTRTIPQRRGNIDRVDGLVTLLKGLNFAFRLTCGVEGYPKIIYINGREKPEKLTKEISDRRSKLASEIVRAGTQGILKENDMKRLVGKLIFEDHPFIEVNKEFFSIVNDQEALYRFLRGYPV